MGFGTQALIVKALHALEDVGWQSQKGPVAPSYALRFTLAYLFAMGGGKDRATFDEFWRAATDLGDHHQSNAHLTNIVRSNRTSTALHGIYRVVGVYRSVEMQFAPVTKRGDRVRKVYPPFPPLTAEQLAERSRSDDE